MSSAEAFVIDGVHYLVITNKGNHNRYQTLSKLYRVNDGGHLTLVSLRFKFVCEDFFVLLFVVLASVY